MAGGMLDLEIGYRVMAQPDPLDGESGRFAPPESVTTNSLQAGLGAPTTSKKVLGMFRPWFDRSDPEVRALCQTAINYLTTHKSYTLLEITLPHLPEGQLAHAMTILSEICSGIPASSLPSLSAPNQILLSIASQTPAADFLQAQKLRNLLMQHLAGLFEENPGMVIVTPTTPNAGCRIEREGDLVYGVSDGNKQVRSMEYVWLANFSGVPAISCPVGYLPVEGVVAKGKGNGEGCVPVGIMGMGEWGDEEGLLEFGYAVEEFLLSGKAGTEDEGENGGGGGAGRMKPETFVDVLGLA